MSGNCAIKGGGRTPNGKCHLKLPFWFFDSVPKRRKAKTVVVKEEINDLYGDNDYYANPDAVTEMVDHNDYYAGDYDYGTDTMETKDIDSEYGY